MDQEPTDTEKAVGCMAALVLALVAFLVSGYVVVRVASWLVRR